MIGTKAFLEIFGRKPLQFVHRHVCLEHPEPARGTNRHSRGCWRTSLAGNSTFKAERDLSRPRLALGFPTRVRWRNDSAEARKSKRTFPPGLHRSFCDSNRLIRQLQGERQISFSQSDLRPVCCETRKSIVTWRKVFAHLRFDFGKQCGSFRIFVLAYRNSPSSRSD